MITINNTMFFDSDDEFYEFAVIPYARVKTVDNNGERESYIDFDMSSMYHKALADNYNFIIRNCNIDFSSCFNLWNKYW